MHIQLTGWFLFSFAGVLIWKWQTFWNVCYKRKFMGKIYMHRQKSNGDHKATWQSELVKNLSRLYYVWTSVYGWGKESLWGFRRLYVIRKNQKWNTNICSFSTFLNNWQVTQTVPFKQMHAKLVRWNELMYPIGILGTQIL